MAFVVLTGVTGYVACALIERRAVEVSCAFIRLGLRPGYFKTILLCSDNWGSEARNSKLLPGSAEIAANFYFPP